MKKTMKTKIQKIKKNDGLPVQEAIVFLYCDPWREEDPIRCDGG